MIDINKNPSKKDLLVFGGLLVIFFSVLGSFFFFRWSNPTVAQGLWLGGGILSLLYSLIPALRRPIYLAWMYLAFPIGWVISHLLLVLIYYGVVTPVGLLLRLFGSDPMRRKLEPDAETYWIEERPKRDAKSYFRQF